jgi:1,4-dihydroxy-2-naphthoate octaprenyltransferase
LLNEKLENILNDKQTTLFMMGIRFSRVPFIVLFAFAIIITILLLLFFLAIIPLLIVLLILLFFIVLLSYFFKSLKYMFKRKKKVRVKVRGK